MLSSLLYWRRTCTLVITCMSSVWATTNEIGIQISTGLRPYFRSSFFAQYWWNPVHGYRFQQLYSNALQKFEPYPISESRDVICRSWSCKIGQFQIYLLRIFWRVTERNTDFESTGGLRIITYSLQSRSTWFISWKNVPQSRKRDRRTNAAPDFYLLTLWSLGCSSGIAGANYRLCV